MADEFKDRPLFHVDTQELASELMTRGSTVIVLMARPRPSATKESEIEVFRQIQGGEVEVKGLVAHIQDYLTIQDMLSALAGSGR